MIRFSFLSGDLNFLDYGGRWLSNEQVSETGEKFFFGIRLENWEDVSGEPGPGNTKYLLELVIIPHPDHISPERVQTAIASSGIDLLSMPVNSVLPTIEALWSHGVCVPVRQLNSNNWKGGMRELRRTAEKAVYEEVLESTVNKIGSTGREYLEGDFLSAIERGLQEGSKDAWIMAKIHGAKEEDLERAGVKNPFKKE